MEEGKRTYKQGKKKTMVSIGGDGGGGIGRVVGWGGALAAATLIAAFTIKKCGGRPTNKDQPIPTNIGKKLKLKNKNKDEGSKGLQLLLQTAAPSPDHIPRGRSEGASKMGVTQIGSLDSVSNQSLLAEKPLLETNGEKVTLKCDDQEVLLSDNSKPEKIPSCDTVHAEQIEEDPPMQSVEEEDVDGEKERELVREKGEESSEVMGDSSMESNAEPIWSTESIEKFSLEFKEIKINFQNSGEKIEEEDRIVKKEDICATINGNNNNEITGKPANSAKLRIWILSMLVLVILLLLLSLTHHEAMSFYLLNGASFTVP